MSLLDDVSIVVTPNGYKAGELYAVIPVPTEGAEEVVDSSFANDLDDWSKYGVTSATGGIATIGASANSGIYQTILTEGVRYTVTINVTSYDGVGLAQVTNGNGTVLYLITETGIQTFTFISAIASGQLIIRGMSNALFSLSSVSVKEFTSADMDVTRATAATRVDENGLVNYAEVLGSELVTCGDFECAVPLNSWSTGTGWSISGGKAIFSGSNFSNLEPSTTIVVVGNTYKLNLIAEVTNGSFKVQNTGNADLITESSSGTYSVVFTATSTLLTIARASVGIQNDFTIDNVSVKEVIRDNVPRIDYTGGGCPHILAEPQRTNLVTYSVDVDSYFTSQVDVTFTNDYGTSPTGDNNSTRVQWADSTSFAYKAVSISTDTSASIFVKGTSGETVMFGFGANVTTGTVYTFDGSWQRITFTGSTGTTIFLSSYGGATATDFQAFGLQLEVGSYATSYIPTSGSTVTRNKDIFSRDGIGSLINSEEGVLFVEMAALSDDLTFRFVSVSDGTNNNRVRINYAGGSNQVGARVVSGGATQSNFVSTLSDIKEYVKIAISYKLNEVKFYVNGSLISTDANATMPIGLSRLALDDGSGSLNFYGKVKQLQVYKTALTDVQLEALTL
jgi:hypothetical protein